MNKLTIAASLADNRIASHFKKSTFCHPLLNFESTQSGSYSMQATDRSSQRIASGFTMVELVVVIILLGVLTAIALPRFVNASSEARAATITSLEGSLRTAIQFALAEDFIAGGNGEPIDINGNTITFIAGNPRPDARQMRFLLNTNLPSATFTSNWSTMPCSGSNFCLVGNLPFSNSTLPSIPNFTGGTGVFIWPEGFVLSDCFVYYLNLADGSEPIVGSDTSGC